MKELHRACFIVVILLQLMSVEQFNAQTISKIKIQNLMTDIEFLQSGLTKLSDEELDNLNSWLQKFTLKILEHAAEKNTKVNDNYDVADKNFNSLQGSIIIADDGQPLGRITTNEFDQSSLLNEFGKYGSEFSSTSIFNKFGTYGSEFSQFSPFNKFTTTPPKIYKDGKFIAYFTVNSTLTPRVDTIMLIAWLKANK